MPSPRAKRRPPRSSSRRTAGPAPVGPGLPGRLDEQLCFALYSATNAMQRTYAPLLKPLGITYLQYLVLLVLFERDDVPVGEIGRRLYLDSGTLTPVLRRLERAGNVTRRRAQQDEREVRVCLTAAGAQLEVQLEPVRAQIGCRAALEPADFAKLRADLRALRVRLSG